MIYNLTCGRCLADTLVDSNFPKARWECSNCGRINGSSLPTIDGEIQMTDVDGATNIIATDISEVDNPEEVVEGLEWQQ